MMMLIKRFLQADPRMIRNFGLLRRTLGTKFLKNAGKTSSSPCLDNEQLLTKATQFSINVQICSFKYNPFPEPISSDFLFSIQEKFQRNHNTSKVLQV